MTADTAPTAPSNETRAQVPLDVAEVIYDGKLAQGWQDWGWGKHQLVEGQPAGIDFGSYGGILLHHAELSEPFGGLSFRYRAAHEHAEFLQVALKYHQTSERILPPVRVETRHVALLSDGWKEVLIPWSELNPTHQPFDQIMIHAHRTVPHGLVQLDKIVLTQSTGERPAAVRPARSATLRIECDKSATPIDPLIYGIADSQWDTGTTARRLGGNPLSRMNWDLGNVYNTGNDWFFENVATKSLDEWIGEDLRQGVKTALVVPLLGWVAKDTTSVGFPVSKFGRQRKHDPYRPEAGDGVAPDGKPLRPGPPSQTSIPAPPDTIRSWIERLRAQDSARGRRGVDMYILDNEPNLWSETHRDVHPEPLSYDELLDRTLRYGTAIRQADPDAVIAGPASWGWTGYFYSAKDLVAGQALRPDRRAHGDVPLLPWYLKQLADHERRTGVRILDVVDVHYYPQATGVWGNAGGGQVDPQTAALRLRATRSLWDESYVDESWIEDRVALIPRLKRWIVENYPGRGISIGEWNFGAEKHMSGGLAVAEVLGRFGQLGVSSAFYWFAPKPGTPASVAFRAYRNYDGAGARFLDFSIPTEAAEKVSLFAARNQSGSRITAIILNLDPESPVDAELDTSRCGQVVARRAFTYRGDPSGLVEEPASTQTGAAPERIAPYSIKVLELSLSRAPGP